MYRFLLLLSLAAPLWAQQDCDPAINDAVADHLNLSTDKLAERTVLAACQPNPDEPAETLTAQAIVGAGYTKDNYNRSLHNDNPWQLLVARVRDGQVQSASSSDEVIDMITDIGNLSLGSTIYELSPDTHAFAVHFSSSAPGEERAIRGKNNEMHLFGTIDGSLRHLAGFATDPWLSSTGDVYPLDPAVKAQCPSCTRQTARNFTINVKDSQHHGLADLEVSAELVASGDGGAADEEIIGREAVLLRFDGSSYKPVSDKWWLEEGLILHDRADDAAAAGAPADAETLADLEFAWRSVRAVRSNAILLAKDGASVGVGMGQVNRVDSCRLAVERAKRYFGRSNGLQTRLSELFRRMERLRQRH